MTESTLKFKHWSFLVQVIGLQYMSILYFKNHTIPYAIIGTTRIQPIRYYSRTLALPNGKWCPHYTSLAAIWNKRENFVSLIKLLYISTRFLNIHTKFI